MSGDELAAERRALEHARSASARPFRRDRLAFAAAHVVFQDAYAQAPHSVQAPGSAEALLAAIDWERTEAFRRHLDRTGFGIAEAMDTAQRFELGWEGARALIERTGALGLEHGFVAGASYDQLAGPPDSWDQSDVERAVAEQIAIVQQAGGVAVVLPLPWLAHNGRGPAHFVDVYGAILSDVEGPVFLHWLGEAFHPAMRDYFPGDSLDAILASDRDKLRGVKLSILDPEREVAIRRSLLPHDQIVLTGDDWAFARMLEGGPAEGAGDDPRPVERWTRIGDWDVALGDFSHALLGIFDATAEPMRIALDWLALGELERWRSWARPCEELGRVVFEAPTSLYKVGLALLAERAGHQPNRLLANHLERERDADHLERVLRAAGEARVLPR